MNRSKFQFTNPELEKIEFIVNKTFDQETFEGICMESNTDIKASKDCGAYVALTVHIGNYEDDQPFNIVIRMSAQFSWENTLDEKLINALLKANAPATLLSYIRPMVASMTMNSRYPVLNIPFIDFSQNKVDD